MIGLVRYNLQIVAPTLLWTGILVGLLVLLILAAHFRNPSSFSDIAAAGFAEQTVPLIAAFFAGGVLDAEMKRGAHELLRAKRRPLWHTVAWRLGISVALALAVGAAALAVLHFGVKRVPLGWLLLSAVSPALALGTVSLWARIRFGNAFLGYVVALAIWVANVMVSLLQQLPFTISINPLLTMSSFTERLQAEARDALLSTPYADWWWVSKVALLVVALAVFAGTTRRVEHLVEGD